MAWDKQLLYLQEFDSFFPSLHVRIPGESEVGAQLELMRAFLQDLPTSAAAEWLSSRNADFKRFYDAAIVTRRLMEVVVELQDQPRKELTERLKKVVVGPLTQNTIPSQAKDFLYELEMATAFKHAGYCVSLREPDIVLEGNGLTRPIGVACKYPSSTTTLERFS
jgi:hypothetical protein